MSDTIEVYGAMFADGFLYGWERARIDVDVGNPRYWLGSGESFTLIRYAVPTDVWAAWGRQGFITGDGYSDAAALAPYEVALVAEWER